MPIKEFALGLKSARAFFALNGEDKATLLDEWKEIKHRVGAYEFQEYLNDIMEGETLSLGALHTYATNARANEYPLTCLKCGTINADYNQAGCLVCMKDKDYLMDRNCGACGQFFPVSEADYNGFHLADKCDASDSLGSLIVGKTYSTEYINKLFGVTPKDFTE